MKYAGMVGTGFSIKDAQGLYDRLAKLATDAPAIENLLGEFLALQVAVWALIVASHI